MNFQCKKSLNEMKICCTGGRIQMSVHMHHPIGAVPVPASRPGTVIAVPQLSLSLTFMLPDGCLGNCLDGSVNVRWVFNRYWFSGTSIVSHLHICHLSPWWRCPQHRGVSNQWILHRDGRKRHSGGSSVWKGDNDLRQTTLSTHYDQQGSWERVWQEV